MENCTEMLKSKLADIVQKNNEAVAALIIKNKTTNEWYESKLKTFDVYQAQIQAELKLHGFEITEINLSRTGMNLDSKIEEDTQLIINAPLKMIGRRKPINYRQRDYDKRGAEKDQRHRDLAHKITDDLYSKFPGFGFNLNGYSLNKTSGILFTIWVK